MVQGIAPPSKVVLLTLSEHSLYWMNSQGKISGNAVQVLVDRSDEWVSHKRGDIPHLTNNRIESQWRKIKDVNEGSFTIDHFISTLVTLQEYAEEQYLSEYHRVGSRPDRNDHTVQIADGGMANVVSATSGDTHDVNTRTCSRNCIFMKTCLLPCRHVMYMSFGDVTSPIQIAANEDQGQDNEGFSLNNGVTGSADPDKSDETSLQDTEPTPNSAEDTPNPASMQTGSASSIVVVRKATNN
eukprot:jgi/Phyca11/16517/fgenesh1_pg.PHYCAscaffold_20_\